jgi:hypothetical protein
MVQHFAVGDRVIAIDEQATGVPQGSLGTVARVFRQAPEICDVKFDDHAGWRAVLANTLAPAPPEKAEHKPKSQASKNREG